uniref:WSN domain-containing protein n=1 Tax=Caenorhabditis tropicalis TaxID=1561998 RepID=A0A1I7TGV1_9PELO
MMKISKFLLTVVLISSTTLSFTTANVAQENSFAMMSEVTAKGARLTAALNALSLFVQPSLDSEEVFREAISTFFTFNRSVIDDFADIDEGEVTRVLKEIGKIGNESIDVADLLSKVKELETIEKNLEGLSPLTGLFKDKIPSVFGELNIERIDLTSFDNNINALDIKAAPQNGTTLPAYASAIAGALGVVNKSATIISQLPFGSSGLSNPTSQNNFANLGPFNIMLSNYTESPAAKALRDLPGQIEKIIGMLSIDDIYSKVMSIFTPLEERKATYDLLTKDIIKSILSLKSEIFEDTDSFRKAANLSKSLSSMCQKMVSTKTFINLSVLEEDLKDPTFLDTLNEERSSEALRMILPPILEISKKVKSHWSGIEDILRNEEFRKSSEKLTLVLSLLMEAVPQKIKFESSLKSIGELSNLADLPVDTTAYLEIKDFIGLLRTYKEELEQLSNSDDVKNMVVSESAINESDFKSKELTTAVKRFKNISYHLDNLNDMRGKIATELKDLKWRHRGKKMDEWIKIVFIPFETKMKESSEVIKRLKSALYFLKERKDLNLPNFHSQIVSLQKKTQEVRGVVEEELKNLDLKEENEPYYKYMINLRIESSPLREQLMRASHIFGLLDHYDRNQTVFDEFFEKGIALQKKIQNDNSKTEDQKKKMNEIESMKKRMDDLKEQMDIRKKRYEGKSMKELFEMRSFIDNLQNLPNPALRTEEWRAIAKSIGDEAADFNKAIDAIFDFDFTLHQRNLIGTFSNYKGYVRYNRLIPKIKDIQKRTYYESNYGPIEFAIFVVESLLVNGLLYLAACYQLRQIDKKEVVREKRIRSDYYRMFAEEFDKKRGFVKK